MAPSPFPPQPSPPHRKRRWVLPALLALAVTIGGVAVWFFADNTTVPSPSVSTVSTSSTTAVVRQQSGGDGPSRVLIPASPLPKRKAPVYSTALAHAYAALGVVADGRQSVLPELDAEAVACLDQARELLARQPVHKQTPRSTVGGGAVLSADGAPSTLVDANVPAALSTSRARLPQPIYGDADKVLTVPDAWLAIPFDPRRTAGKPLTISNQSGGEYGFSVNGDDMGTVRVNGGLVVPGRFYRLDNATTISCDVPVNVHLRPLSALPQYSDAPQPPPQANG